VDDYFAKPLHIDKLVNAISAVRSGKRSAGKALPTRKVSQLLEELSSLICERWLRLVMSDRELAALPLTEAERSDHIPDMMEELIRRLEGHADEFSEEATDAARKHGKLRYQQNYTIPQIVFEARLLQQVLSSTIHDNLFGIDLSTLVQDILEIGETLQADVEVSIRAYQSQIPRSLQTSFSLLYQSPYLGVYIADEHHIIDANDAFLRMTGHTREQLAAGKIDWRAMTPDKFRALDVSAMEQLREFGTCVPYEKEYVLPDGSSLPFLIGAVRLSVRGGDDRAAQVTSRRRKGESLGRKVWAHQSSGPRTEQSVGGDDLYFAPVGYLPRALRRHPEAGKRRQRNAQPCCCYRAAGSRRGSASPGIKECSAFAQWGWLRPPAAR
jgi:PAS domain S-box-containing protein